MKKDLEYYRKNAGEDYLTTPISVLRYIGLVEKRVKVLTLVIVVLFLAFLGGLLIKFLC